MSTFLVPTRGWGGLENTYHVKKEGRGREVFPLPPRSVPRRGCLPLPRRQRGAKEGGKEDTIPRRCHHHPRPPQKGNRYGRPEGWGGSSLGKGAERNQRKASSSNVTAWLGRAPGSSGKASKGRGGCQGGRTGVWESVLGGLLRGSGGASRRRSSRSLRSSSSAGLPLGQDGAGVPAFGRVAEAAEVFGFDVPEPLAVVKPAEREVQLLQGCIVGVGVSYSPSKQPGRTR